MTINEAREIGSNPKAFADRRLCVARLKLSGVCMKSLQGSKRFNEHRAMIVKIETMPFDLWKLS